ncbi:unnamed protein product, partial [Rangifer tarandus platyrhynchus]
MVLANRRKAANVSKSPTHRPSSPERSKTGTNIPPVSGVSDTAGGPPSPVADDPPALPFPSSGRRRLSPIHSMPAPVCQLLRWTAVLFKPCHAIIITRAPVGSPVIGGFAIRVPVLPYTLTRFGNGVV